MRQLSDNMPALVDIAKEAAQPEVIEMLHHMVVALKDGKQAETSMFGLLRQLNDPQVRQGLARTLQVLKAVGQ